MAGCGDGDCGALSFSGGCGSGGGPGGRVGPAGGLGWPFAGYGWACGLRPKSRARYARAPRLPRFVLLVSFSDTLLLVSILDMIAI